jgi:nickel/cobalt exporter
MARVLVCLAVLLANLVAALPSVAQEAPQRSPLGITLPSQAAQEGAQAKPPAAAGQASPRDRIWAWMVRKQQEFKQSMSAAVRELRTGDPWFAAAWISALAFGYGLLHAAGPGHGKAIISSYVLANERTLKRGIYLSFLSALIQALSAIAFVGVLALVLKATSMTIRSAEAWTETLSWAFVALVGAWLLYRQIKLLMPARAAPAHAHGTAHGHAHGHENHHHAHGPGEACSCGHSHAPDARLLEGDAFSMRKAFAIAFAVGIRPCTGALALLFLTLTQGLLWAGILGTFAMALGTAIMVSVLACMAIGSRELANKFAGEGSHWGRRIETAAGLTGSTLVLLLGTVFFIGSLQAPAPL